jgi:hypothetical protein
MYGSVTFVLSLSADLKHSDCFRYNVREENKRWLLESLHQLILEGQSKHPSLDFNNELQAALQQDNASQGIAGGEEDSPALVMSHPH